MGVRMKQVKLLALRQTTTTTAGIVIVAIISMVIVSCSPSESAVDDDFLSEQLKGIAVPDGEGAVMVAVVDAAGAVDYASEGSDPTGRPLGPEAVFRTGSITKMFTAVLVLSLVDDGVVDLDSLATEYVARVPVPEGVTVRDLLGHTSGIPDYLDLPTSFLQTVLDDPHRAWSPEEVVALVADEEPLFVPGAQYSYSNTNYTILGVLIEEVTAMSFASALRARILEPLGLDNTYLAGFEEGPDPFGAYTSLDGPTKPVDFEYTAIATGAWAAGGVVSSVADLHVLLSALFNERVISAESLAAMTENTEEGFGISRFSESGEVYGLGGVIPGYLTLVLHAPHTGRTAVLIVTNDGVSFDRPIEQLAAYISRS